MLYVKRNTEGQIVAISKTADADYELENQLSMKQIRQFFQNTDLSDAEIAQISLDYSDSALARVTEDLIHLLISKQTILFTDLPSAVQQKLLVREKLREGISDIEQSGFNETDTI